MKTPRVETGFRLQPLKNGVDAHLYIDVDLDDNAMPSILVASGNKNVLEEYLRGVIDYATMAKRILE